MSSDTTSFDQMAPANIQAEQALLGAVLLRPAVLDEVAGLLPDAKAFYRLSHRCIFEAMRELHGMGQDVDVVLLGERLKDRRELQDQNIDALLIELAEASPSSEGAAQYAEIIQDKYFLRCVAREANELRDKAFSARASASDLAASANECLHRLLDLRVHRKTMSLADIMADFTRDMQRNVERHALGLSPGISSGLVELDAALSGGFRGGEFAVLASRPGNGKSSIGLGIADAVCEDDLKHREGGVYFVSLEMRNAETVTRLLCSRLGIPINHVREGLVTPQQQRLFEREILRWQNQNKRLFLDCNPYLTWAEIAARARRLRERGEIRMLVVDYIGLVTPRDRSLPRHEQVSEISRGMKALALELDLAVIALSQLNRAIETRRSAEPILSDLRESGSLEQDADIVGFPWRKSLSKSAEESEYFDGDDGEYISRDRSYLKIAKNRNGPAPFTINLWFDKPLARFSNFEGAEHRARAMRQAGRDHLPVSAPASESAEDDWGSGRGPF